MHLVPLGVCAMVCQLHCCYSLNLAAIVNVAGVAEGVFRVDGVVVGGHPVLYH